MTVTMIMTDDNCLLQYHCQWYSFIISYYVLKMPICQLQFNPMLNNYTFVISPFLLVCIKKYRKSWLFFTYTPFVSHGKQVKMPIYIYFIASGWQATSAHPSSFSRIPRHITTACWMKTVHQHDNILMILRSLQGHHPQSLNLKDFRYANFKINS